MMEYKGYTARVEFDDEAEIFHGGVIGVKDVITFKGKTAKKLKKASGIQWTTIFPFVRGEAPDKPFTGQFVVRISPQLHRKIYLCAKLSTESIDAWLNEKLVGVVNEELEKWGA